MSLLFFLVQLRPTDAGAPTVQLWTTTWIYSSDHGGLLIVHPFIISVDELADRDPVYERTNISVYASGVDWERGTAAVPWKGIDCVEEDAKQHRRCALKQALVKEHITIPGDTPLERRGSSPDPYVLLRSGFYERTYK